LPLSQTDAEIPGSADPGQFLSTDHLETDLAARSVRGGLATILSQGCKFVLQLGAMVVLARLLSPAEFGLVAMVVVVLGFVTVFKDMGLSMATVQRKDVTHAQISTLLWINLVFSVAILAIMAALAPLISWFYGEPRLTWITIVLSGSLIFAGLTVQHQALLRRQMRFGRLAVIEVGSMLVGVATGIVTAWAGVGYWALVLMQLAKTAAMAVGVWCLCGWRPGPPRRKSGVRSMLAFGGYLSGFNIINYSVTSVDKMLIGWRWGAGLLGLYDMAYRLLLLPVQQITTPISGVAIPTLSRLQGEPERYRLYYRTAVNLLAWTAVPPMAALAALSGPVIGLVFGPQWLPAAPIFKLLAIAAILRPLTSTAGWIYVTLGKTKRLFFWSLMVDPAKVAALVLGLPFGAKGVAIAYSSFSVILVVPSLLWAFHRTPVSLSDFFAAVWRPLTVSGGVYAIIELTRLFLGPVGDGWALASSGVVGTVLLVAAVTLWPSARREVKGLIAMCNRLLRGT